MYLSLFLGGEEPQGVLGNEIVKGVQEMIKRKEDDQTTLLMHQHFYYTHMHSAEFVHNQLVETKFRINFLESYKAGNRLEMEHHWITGSHIHVRVRHDFNLEFFTFGLELLWGNCTVFPVFSVSGARNLKNCTIVPK